MAVEWGKNARLKKKGTDLNLSATFLERRVIREKLQKTRAQRTYTSVYRAIT